MSHESLSSNKLVECVGIAFPTSVMAAVGWLAHTLATVRNIPNAHSLIGGVLFSGFIGWVGCMAFLAVGLPPETAAPAAAIVGASGERGYHFFLNQYLQDKQYSDSSNSQDPPSSK